LAAATSSKAKALIAMITIPTLSMAWMLDTRPPGRNRANVLSGVGPMT
jgi:hypothetical protein